MFRLPVACAGEHHYMSKQKGDGMPGRLLIIDDEPTIAIDLEQEP
jgi:hypothetical protein